MSFEPLNETLLCGRWASFAELNYGRAPGYNPILSQALTVAREYDPTVKDFRPIVVPITQIFDPFGEVSFHSSYRHTNNATDRYSSRVDSPPVGVAATTIDSFPIG
jgi:hypothetical protein